MFQTANMAMSVSKLVVHLYILWREKDGGRYLAGKKWRGRNIFKTFKYFLGREDEEIFPIIFYSKNDPKVSLGTRLQNHKPQMPCSAVWPTGILRCRFFQKQQLRKIKSIKVSAQDAFFHLIRGFQKHPKVFTYLIKRHLDIKKRHLSILKSLSPCSPSTNGRLK